MSVWRCARMQAVDRSGRQVTWCSVACECVCVQVFRQWMKISICREEVRRYVYSRGMWLTYTGLSLLVRGGRAAPTYTGLREGLRMGNVRDTGRDRCPWSCSAMLFVGIDYAENDFGWLCVYGIYRFIAAAAALGGRLSPLSYVMRQPRKTRYHRHTAAKQLLDLLHSSNRLPRTISEHPWTTGVSQTPPGLTVSPTSKFASIPTFSYLRLRLQLFSSYLR